MMALLSKAVSAISALEAQAVDQRRHADGVEPMTGQQDKAHEIPEGVGERENLGRQTAFGTADGLALSSPFCALAVAMDLDDGCVDHGVFHVRFIRTGLEKPHEDVGFDPISDIA